MSTLDFNEWRLNRIRGAIEEYMRGIKKRASDINWIIGVLKGSFGASKKEALELIEFIKNDKTIIMTPERIKRLEELKARIEREEW